MKILKVIKKILMGIAMFIFFTFAVTMTVLLLNYNNRGVTQFGETSLILIKGDISSDNYKKGDLVIVEGKRVNKINVGDEIFVYRLETDGSVTIDVGLIGEVNTEQRVVSFANGDDYTEDFIIGKASKIYNKIGGYLSIVESTVGFLFMIIIPSFLIFVYQLYALIIEIKYGKDEDQKS